MKVLFVCHQNVGRSQMAKAFYNDLVPTNNAEAAGTTVDIPGQTLLERKNSGTSRNFYLLDAMQEVGFDLSQSVRRPLDKNDLTKYDEIICMEKPKLTPDWLLNSSKYTYWDVPDPRGQDLVHTRRTRDLIQTKIKELVHTTSPEL